MTNNNELKPNDILCIKDKVDNDITKSPTIDEKQKEDTQHHPKRKHHKRTLTRGHLYCLQCGNEITISDSQYKMLVSEKMSRQSKLQSRHMGRRERHKRAVLAGLSRAIKAGQTLKKSTIDKCTGRKIYKEVSIPLQIQNPSTA